MPDTDAASSAPTEGAAGATGDNVRPIRADVERTASLEIVPGQRFWTAEQAAALASIGLGECPDADRMAFLHLCQSTGLDPFRREIYLLGRKAKQGNQWVTRWTPQTGIDGFRHLAEETGVYGGRVGPQWAGAQGRWVDVWLDPEPPRAARCGVIRNDRPIRCRQCGGEPGGDVHGVEGHLGDGQHVFDDERITWAIALYDEYVPLEDEYAGNGDSRQKTGNKIPTSMWRKMPANQLAKCAEAAAVRAAFPRRAAGLYEHAEMDAASQVAKDLEESERDRQRRELATRPWQAGPGGAKGVVLDPDAPSGEVAPRFFDRAALLAELEDQAKTAGKTTAQYAMRWVKAHRKNIEDATDAELEDFLAARRTTPTPPAVEETPAEQPVAAAEAETPADHGLTVHDVARPSDDPSDDEARQPGEGQTALLGVDQPQDVPLHVFEPTQDDPETCAFGCGFDAGDPVHLG